MVLVYAHRLGPVLPAQYRVRASVVIIHLVHIGVDVNVEFPIYDPAYAPKHGIHLHELEARITGTIQQS